MEYDVVSFEFLDGYRLRVQFADGVTGILDLTPRLTRDEIAATGQAVLKAYAEAA